MDGDRLWAWQEREPNGRWGIIAAIVPRISRAPVPLVFRSERHALAAETFALAHKRASGHSVRLACFSITMSRTL